MKKEWNEQKKKQQPNTRSQGRTTRITSSNDGGVEKLAISICSLFERNRYGGGDGGGGNGTRYFVISLFRPRAFATRQKP